MTKETIISQEDHFLSKIYENQEEVRVLLLTMYEHLKTDFVQFQLGVGKNSMCMPIDIHQLNVIQNLQDRNKIEITINIINSRKSIKRWYYLKLSALHDITAWEELDSVLMEYV